MVFPRTGLPNEVSARVREQTGTDDDDNPQYDTVEVLRRPARFYRDSGRELVGATDTDVVEGMVAFPAESGDTLDLIPADAELLIHKGQFPEDGKRFQIVHPTLQMLWSRPSHWEISIGRTG